MSNEFILKQIAINKRMIALLLKVNDNLTDEQINILFDEVSKEVDEIYKKYDKKGDNNENT